MNMGVGMGVVGVYGRYQVLPRQSLVFALYGYKTSASWIDNGAQSIST
jgi:hypothetical protein